jgi:hypothetical protein
MAPVFMAPIKQRDQKQDTLRTEKRLYSVSELARDIGATKWFWRTQIWSGNIPTVRVGKKQLIDIKDIERFINEHKTTPN